MSRRIGLIFQGFLHLAAANPIFRSFRCTRVIRDTAFGETENGIGLPQLVISHIHTASQHAAGLKAKDGGPAPAGCAPELHHQRDGPRDAKQAQTQGA